MSLKKKLISRIRKEFPQVRFKTAKLITKGWDHDVLVLDSKFIFRFAKEKLYKNSFFREVSFLKEFSKISNIQVPKYTFLSKDKSFGGYEMIRGRELTPRIYQKLSSNKKQKIIRQVAKFLSILHNVPLKKAQAFGFKDYKSWTQSLQEKQKWFEREFYSKMSKYLTPKQNVFVRKFISHFTQVQAKIKPVLGHFDLSHDHILLGFDGTISGIIDFGDISISDPAHEFNGFHDYDHKLPKQIYQYYKGPKDSTFLERCKDHFIHRWVYLLYDAKIRRKDESLWRVANQRINKIIKTTVL